MVRDCEMIIPLAWLGERCVNRRTACEGVSCGLPMPREISQLSSKWKWKSSTALAGGVFRRDFCIAGMR